MGAKKEKRNKVFGEEEEERRRTQSREVQISILGK